MKHYHILLILLVLLTSGINAFILSGAHHILSFDNIILYSFYGVFAILSSIIIYNNIKYSMSGKRNIISFTPSLIVILSTFSFIYTTRYIHRLDASPVVFTAYGMQDFNGVYIDFREDSTYRITEYVLFAANYYRGTYKLKDSIIVLLEGDQYRKKGNIKSNRFKIILDIDTITNVTNKALIQIDDTQCKIEHSEVFSIR